MSEILLFFSVIDSGQDEKQGKLKFSGWESLVVFNADVFT